MACKASAGLTFTCEDLLSVGGVSPVLWFGYLSELDTQFSLTQAADISQMDFGSYGGLRRLEGNKFSHSAGYTLVEAAGGNKSYTQSVTIKVVSNSTADDLTLHNMSLGNDLFFVVQDSNRVFKLYGAGQGLKATANTQNTGQTGDSDTTNQLTFEGQELTLPLRFALGGGYQATLDYIEGREI